MGTVCLVDQRLIKVSTTPGGLTISLSLILSTVTQSGLSPPVHSCQQLAHRCSACVLSWHSVSSLLPLAPTTKHVRTRGERVAVTVAVAVAVVDGEAVPVAVELRVAVAVSVAVAAGLGGVSVLPSTEARAAMTWLTLVARK